MRAKITLSYDGSFFNGFQIQKNEIKNKKSVAGVITQALKKLNIHSKVVGSGRTDACVHATHQVIHFDLPSFWVDPVKLKRALNELLVPHIYIQTVRIVEDTFHARFSAQKRLYRYVLYDGIYQPMLANYALHVKSLEVQHLNQYAKLLIGKHNFEFFKKQGGGTTKDEREIFNAGAYRYKNFIIIYFSGDAFLRSQVRMMCDFLIKIAHKQLTTKDLEKQLCREEKVSTKLCPACGLYLSKVYY